MIRSEATIRELCYDLHDREHMLREAIGMDHYAAYDSWRREAWENECSRIRAENSDER